jgi:exosome complex component RRP45
MHHQPFCVTASYYDQGSIMLLDATLLEEQLREGEVIVGMNRFGEICQLAKYGGTAVDGLALLRCTEKVLERVKEFDKLVKEELAKDEKRRDRGGLMAELRADNER